MNERPAVEVADVFRDCGPRYLAQFGAALTPEQRRAVRDLSACRTAVLGGHVEACDRCDARRVSYNSCRNRHCPKCQGTRTAIWLTREAAHVLPVEYFHVVFTVPAEVAALALQNPPGANPVTRDRSVLAEARHRKRRQRVGVGAGAGLS